jgi:hypothetical protein
VKNKARLSIMTAFSFGYQPKDLKTDQLDPFKRAAVIVFFPRFICKNETSKESPKLKILSLLKVFFCQTTPEGGIILSRLLVSVYIRAKSLNSELDFGKN